MFTSCIAEMEDIRCRGVNMSTFMFELIWGNWDNALEATGFLGELEGIRDTQYPPEAGPNYLRVLKSFVPPNKGRFDGLWCSGYVTYSYQLARKGTSVLLPRRVEVRRKDLNVFGLNPPAE